MSIHKQQLIAKPSGKLWGGRFSGGLDPLMIEYNQSIYYDRAFHSQDIAGSIAWARANHNAGILLAEEFTTIQNGLEEVEREWVEGRFEIKPGIDEDIHTANERRLSELGTNPSDRGVTIKSDR